MSLPKLDVPTYSLEILSTGTQIKYRPFLVKEEKILLLALENGETPVIINAIKQIIESCIIEGNINIVNLPLFDLENIFLNIRSKSIGETSTINIPCTSETCETYSSHTINLEEINLIVNDSHDKNIKLQKNIGIIMKYPSVDMITTFEDIEETNIEQSLNIMISCIETIYDENNEYDFRDYTQQEKNDFIEQLTQQQILLIQEFFNTMPSLQYELEFKCSTCGTEDIIPIAGLQNFFS